MEKERLLFVSSDELFKKGKRKICVFADGLTKEEQNSVTQFLKKNYSEDKIDFLFSSIRESILHENINLYPSLKEFGNIINYEFLRLLMCDEVWIFNDGYNYIFNGRLDSKIKLFDKPVYFLYRDENDMKWKFYLKRDIVYDENNDDIIENLYLIC